MQRGLRITLAVAAAAGAVALSAGTAFADTPEAPALPSADSISTPAVPSADSAETPALPEAGTLPSADSLQAPAVDAPKLGDSQKNSLPLGK
ncbi:hypothetical protein [Pseudonocardia spinosispora]|uniref:hypothetical protein n=1 Tax=Pseudonocardia spinosispora TaxID=103441 RepID=UPI0003F6B5F0|nr:hypothetical protein [Pseudonocardia spinosispora]